MREVSGIAVDSRKCFSGALYVALRGEKTDGHLFLEQAAEKGAIAALVEVSFAGDTCGLTLIRVPSPLEALQHLAKIFLRRREVFVIGVTGSVGKTTVKEFIATLLSPFYAVDKSPDSYNGQIGVPLAILHADPRAKILVLEMGMSYKGEMDRLVDIASPHFSVVTRVAPAHLGHFASLEEIAHEKGRILGSSRLQRAFIHSRNTLYPDMKGVSYGSASSDVYFCKKKNKWILVDKERNETCEITPPFSEAHLMENLLVAAKVAREMGVSYEKLLDPIKKLRPFTHRFEKIALEYPAGVILIDDSYNNNPIALKASLYNLPKPKRQGKKIAVLGEMRELGEASYRAHQELGLVALRAVDCLLCYGQEAKPLYEMFAKHNPHAHHFLDQEKLAAALEACLAEDDVVLLKGANSNKLWEIIEKLKKPLVKIC